MPRKEPKLVPFLQKALEKNIRNKKKNLNPKYRNLMYEDNTKKVLSLFFPHKKESLNKADELIFKDWYKETGREYNFYKDYSIARQAMTQSLRKSIYVDMELFDNKLTVWILSKEEVKEKKRLQKLKAEQKSSEQDVLSDDSGFFSPESCVDHEEVITDILQGIEHDHAYGFSPPVTGSPEEGDFRYHQQKDFNEAVVDSEMKDASGAFEPLVENSEINKMMDTYGIFQPSNLDYSYQIKSNVMDVCASENFSGIPACSENVMLKDLYEIPDEKFIGVNFQESPLTSQVDWNDAKMKNSFKCYLCKHCEVTEEKAILMCQLSEDRNADVDISGNIGIVYDETVKEKIAEYPLPKTKRIDDQYIMVIFERS